MKPSVKYYLFSSFPLERPWGFVTYQPDKTLADVAEEIQAKQVCSAGLAIYKLQGELVRDPTESLQQRVHDWLERHGEENLDLSAHAMGRLWPEGGRMGSTAFELIAAEESVIRDFRLVRDLLDRGLLPPLGLIEESQSLIRHLKFGPKPSEASIDPSACYCGEVSVRGGRPVSRYGPPNAIFDRRLARLAHELTHLDTVDVSPLAIRVAHQLLLYSADFYLTDAARDAGIRPLLEVLFRRGMWQTEVPGGNTPFWPVRLVYELKNERGQGGDPETQAIAQYIKLLADEKWTRLAEASNCPAILFTIAGTHLAISTAILTDTVYVEDLYSINLHACFNLEARLLNLARALHAVKCAFEEPGVISQDGSHLLPKPVGLDGAYLLGLRFFRKLPHRGLGAPDTTDTRSQDRAYALYLAIGDGTHIPSKEVVVKFPRYRYNPTAHALLAAQNLAPKLYSHNPVLGAHSMVVMDVVEGITAWEWVHSGRKLPRSVYADIERAVVLLREHNLVFGDLRLPNIMVRPDGSGALVDFDWADEDERGRYPALLAEDPDEWAPGVQKYGLMLKHHDRHMLEKLKEYCERPV